MTQDSKKLPYEHSFHLAVKIYAKRFRVLLAFSMAGYLFLGLLVLITSLPKLWWLLPAIILLVLLFPTIVYLKNELKGVIISNNETVNEAPDNSVDNTSTNISFNQIKKEWKENTSSQNEDISLKAEQSVLRFCTNCGSENKNRSNFCLVCGTHLNWQ